MRSVGNGDGASPKSKPGISTVADDELSSVIRSGRLDAVTVAVLTIDWPAVPILTIALTFSVASVPTDSPPTSHIPVVSL